MISAEQLVGEELAEWYSLTPLERWRESARLWEVYLSLGGSLDPEPDTQSPFFDPSAPSSRPVDERPRPACYTARKQDRRPEGAESWNGEKAGEFGVTGD